MFILPSNDHLEEKDNGKNDHTLTSHERSHKELAREYEWKSSNSRWGVIWKLRKGKQGMESKRSIRENFFSLKKNPVLVETTPCAFIDPCPTSVCHLTVREFSSSEINWKMMTAFRPMDKTDESIFSRFIKDFSLNESF